MNILYDGVALKHCVSPELWASFQFHFNHNLTTHGQLVSLSPLLTHYYTLQDIRKIIFVIKCIKGINYNWKRQFFKLKDHM